MAHTNTSRNGSSGSLNFVSRSSFTIRCRCGVMSKPFALKSAASFWACDTTTAMSVVFIQFSVSRMASCSSCVALAIDSFSFASCLVHCAFTLSYIRTAVSLSMQTTIPFPLKPRPVKCSTMSAATRSSRSSRVIRWYCWPSTRSSLRCWSSSSSDSSITR